MGFLSSTRCSSAPLAQCSSCFLVTRLNNGGLFNGVGVDRGDVEGMVTRGLVTETVGGEEVDGVGRGYMTGTGGGMVEEGMFVDWNWE